jgi:carboxypeptidase family protein
MDKPKLFSLLIAATIFLFVSCGGKKTEVSEQPSETPAEAPPTPIDQSTVGSINGKILFQGTKLKLAVIHMDQDPVCVQKHTSPVQVEDGAVNSNGTLPNVFVYVKEGAEKYTFTTPTEPVVLDQNGCMYKPHVLGIQVNQDLHVISSDPTTHNIHPMPKDNREWNESQTPGAAPLDKKFARAEIMIPVKCNQHPWMKAYIGVTKNPFFAVTGSDGTFTIKGLPPGDYTIGAWTALFGAQEQKVTLGPKETKTVDITFKAS